MLRLAQKTNGHTHFVYIYENLEEPIARSSKADKHYHDVVFDPSINDFVVIEAEGHTHLLKNVVRKEIELIPDDSDQDKVAGLYDLYKYAYNEDKDNIEDAIESDEFYNGEQWEESV